jgi:hypothetical protein
MWIVLFVINVILVNRVANLITVNKISLVKAIHVGLAKKNTNY